MPQTIPTFNDGTVSYTVTLNTTNFFIRLYFNEFASMWFLDLLDNDSNPIALGLALVPNVNILRYSRALTQTIGQMRISTVNTGNDTTTSLGDDATLFYFLPGEFEALFPNYNNPDVRVQQFVFDDLFIPFDPP